MVITNDDLWLSQGESTFSGNFHQATFYYATTQPITAHATNITVIEEKPNSINLGCTPILLFIGILLVVIYTITSIVLCCIGSDYLSQKRIFEYEMEEWKRNASNRVRSILKVCPEEEYDTEKNIYEQKTCVVCLGEFTNTRIRKLRCSHIFHSECIKSWIQQKIIEVPKCPMCNKELTSLQPPSAEIEREFETAFEEIEI